MTDKAFQRRIYAAKLGRRHEYLSDGIRISGAAKSLPKNIAALAPDGAWLAVPTLWGTGTL